MEIKKTPKADLENKKSTWLLVGYVIVLAFMFIAFEWTNVILGMKDTSFPERCNLLFHYSETGFLMKALLCCTMLSKCCMSS